MYKRQLTLIFLFFCSVSSRAALITDNTIINPTVIDFSSQTTAKNQSSPLQIGAGFEDITASASGDSIVLSTNASTWILNENGYWGGGMTYISTNGFSTLTFAFNEGPVASVGGFINHSPRTDLIISALDANMNLLETYNITQLANIVTPDGINEGAFRGIVRDSNDIQYFTVTGLAPVLDDFAFYRTTVVPVPGSILLFGAGIVSLIGVGRKKKL